MEFIVLSHILSYITGSLYKSAGKQGEDLFRNFLLVYIIFHVLFSDETKEFEAVLASVSAHARRVDL